MVFQKGDLFCSVDHLYVYTLDHRDEEAEPNEIFLLVGFSEHNKLVLVSQVTGSYSEWFTYHMKSDHGIFIQLT